MLDPKWLWGCLYVRYKFDNPISINDFFKEICFVKYLDEHNEHNTKSFIEMFVQCLWTEAQMCCSVHWKNLNELLQINLPFPS